MLLTVLDHNCPDLVVFVCEVVKYLASALQR